MRNIDEFLSPSERKAIAILMEAMCGERVKVVKVLKLVEDNKTLSRTTFINAIKKLNIAGIIKSKSMGMKGCYIEILEMEILNYDYKGK